MKTHSVTFGLGAMGLLLNIFGCESHTLPAEKPKTEVDSIVDDGRQFQHLGK